MEKKRNLGRIHWWLNSAAEHIIAGKVKLNSVLLAGASSETGADAKRNISRGEGCHREPKHDWS